MPTKSYKIGGLTFEVVSDRAALSDPHVTVTYRTVDQIIGMNHHDRTNIDRTKFWQQVGHVADRVAQFRELIRSVVASRGGTSMRAPGEVERVAKMGDVFVDMVLRAPEIAERDPGLRLGTAGGHQHLAREKPFVDALDIFHVGIRSLVGELVISQDDAARIIGELSFTGDVIVGTEKVMADRVRTASARIEHFKMLKTFGPVGTNGFADWFELSFDPPLTKVGSRMISHEQTKVGSETVFPIFFKRVSPFILLRTPIVEFRGPRQLPYLRRPVMVFAPALFRVLEAVFAHDQAAGIGGLVHRRILIPTDEMAETTQQATLEAVADADLVRPMGTQVITDKARGGHFLSPLELALVDVKESRIAAAQARRTGSSGSPGGTSGSHDFVYATTRGEAELNDWRANMEIVWRLVYGHPRRIGAVKLPMGGTELIVQGYSRADTEPGGEIDRAISVVQNQIIDKTLSQIVMYGAASPRRILSDYQYMVGAAAINAHRIIEFLVEQKRMVNKQGAWV